MTSIFILEYAEKGSTYRKSISNTFVSCRKIGGKTYVAMQGGEGKHDFAEKYTPLFCYLANITIQNV